MTPIASNPAQANLIREAPALVHPDLADLLAGQIAILRIPQYFSTSFIEAFLSGIRNVRTEAYDHEMEFNGQKVYEYYGVDRIGTSFNTTYSAHPQARDTYYAQAVPGTRLIRQLAANGLSPVDRFRLELDELHPEGAQIGRFEGHPMLAGITRITTGEKAHLLGCEPHFDFLPKRFKTFKRQLAANFYLQVPEDGGHLQIWPTPEDLQEDFMAPQNWVRELDCQDHGSISYYPTPGDLVLFNVRRPHAVHSFQGQDRVSLQCFFGYNPNEAIQLWN